ncbi:hypothetical protein FNU76_13040 [Chitinimonas arctica]|uniref:Uncharacterized protein n=1 Tax=Chitinimonas arctica TaxID=2594795 RepID=A0A516SGF2_9NEIS|nr:hypothetical protein [Chitinimonas arctica]QDQ27212.1 hypothetical protein FNU76_13040 [Chitinimonas arctica]
MSAVIRNSRVTEYLSVPLSVLIGATIGNEHGIHSADLPTHTFELRNTSSDFLEHALFFGQELRIKRIGFTHKFSKLDWRKKTPQLCPG